MRDLHAQWLAEFEFEEAQDASRTKESFSFFGKKKEDPPPSPSRPPQIRDAGTVLNPHANLAPLDDDYEMFERDLRFSTSSEEEQELIRQYQSDPTPENLEPLFARHQDTINRVINRYSTRRVPLPMIQGRVYTTFVEAADKYSIDPEKNRGAGLGSFFHTQMRNSNRYINRYSQFAKAGDNDTRWMESVKNEIDKATRDGKHLTDDELSSALKKNQQLSLSASEIKKLRNSLRKEFQSSRDNMADSKFDIESLHRRAINSVRQQYTYRDQQIIDHLFGLNGHDMTDKNDEIADAVGVSSNFVSRRKKDMRMRFQAEMERLLNEERPFE